MSVPLDSWVSARPHLLLHERQLAQAATQGRIAISGGSIVFEEALRRPNGVIYAYQVRFAPDHPHSPPVVHLLRPTLPVSVAVHRYRNGELCLHAPEEWHPSNTVSVWLRNRVVAWIRAVEKFSQTGLWPDR